MKSFRRGLASLFLLAFVFSFTSTIYAATTTVIAPNSTFTIDQIITKLTSGNIITSNQADKVRSLFDGRITPIIPATAKSVGKASLKLSYDSSKNESSLDGSQDVYITAGTSDILVSGVYLGLNEKTGIQTPHGITPNVTKYTWGGTSGTTKESLTDTYGNSLTVWRVRAGQTGYFTTKISTSPSQMYAGVYTASLFNYFNIATLSNGVFNSTAINFTPDQSSESDKVVVVGEKAVPSITVISPNGGENFVGKKTIDVKWNSQNLSNLNVSIDLVSNAGYIVNLVSNIKNTGLYTVSLPSDLKEGQYKIIVSTFDKGPSAQDYSDGYFSTINSVTQPISCSDLKMVLDSQPATSISYSYQNDTCDGYRNVQGDKVSPACYSIKECSNISGANCVDISKAKLQCSISTKPSFAVISPNGGENLTLGQKYKITWNKGKYPDVNVTIGIKNTKFYQGYVGITGAIPNTGSYEWVVAFPTGGGSPNFQPGDNYSMSIGNVYNTNNYYESDVSDSTFSISGPTSTQPSSLITSPKASSTVLVGNAGFTATATGGTGSYKYNWDFGDGGGASSMNFEGSSQTTAHYFNVPGIFTTTLSVVDSNGNKAPAQFAVVRVVAGPSIGQCYSAVPTDYPACCNINDDSSAKSIWQSAATGNWGKFGKSCTDYAGYKVTPSNSIRPPALGGISYNTKNINQTLRAGQSGDQVATLQTALQQAGVYSGPITGFFGDLTKKAVSAFQQANALEAIGEVGPKTRELLNSLFR